MVIYNKAIRDKIPEIIKESGKNCNVKKLDNSEFLIRLEKKLVEELEEYQESKNVEELADGDVEEIFDDLEDADDFDSSKITQDLVSAWVDRAREESLVYIMSRLLNIAKNGERKIGHPNLLIK